MVKTENVTEQPIKVSPFVSLTARDILSTFVAGLIVGALYLGGTYLLDTYIFSSVLCRAQSSGDCSQAPHYAMIVASVVSGLLGVGLLVRLRIYRPLLIVIASLVSLWGLALVLHDLPLLGAIVTSAVLVGLSFAVFTWFIRIRSFIVALIAVVILIVAIRLVLQS